MLKYLFKCFVVKDLMIMILLYFRMFGFRRNKEKYLNIKYWKILIFVKFFKFIINYNIILNF